MKHTVIFPASQLPGNEAEQLDVLIPYFSGQQVHVTAGPTTVAAEVEWPTSEEFYVDPRLREGLEWWQAAMPLPHLPLAVVQRPRYQLSLNDNWTLYAWSQWLARQRQAGNWPEEIVVLHIDDHRDCMAPLLFQQTSEESLRDGITGAVVDVAQPATVAAAIRSGAISVGSFLTVLLHYCPRVQLRHLFPLHRTAAAYPPGSVSRITQSDELLGAAFQRPALQFEVADSATGLTYLPTDKMARLLADIPAGVPVLLHVDMDYFNNRFDGDSDWLQHDTIHDPSAAQVLTQVREVFQAVIAGVAPAQLADITVALSPGFFPAELWQPSIAEIDTLLS
jgi:hypothetical protein